MFIDTLEIEEMLSEYYDFSEFTDTDWEKVDSIVRKTCKARGVSPTRDYDTYCAICDGAVAKVLKAE